MQKKYPENIAELESFYRTSLDGIQIEPPAALWDRIEASLDEKRKPKGFFFLTYKRSMFISAAAVLIAAIGYFAIKNSDNPSEKNIPATTVDSATNEKIQTSPEAGTIIQDSPKENPKAFKGSKTKEQTPEAPATTENSALPVTPIVADTTSAKTSSEITPTITEEKPKEKSKEKVSFKDKYRKNYQDSTRPIFVPEKK